MVAVALFSRPDNTILAAGVLLISAQYLGLLLLRRVTKSILVARELPRLLQPALSCSAPRLPRKLATSPSTCSDGSINVKIKELY